MALPRQLQRLEQLDTQIEQGDARLLNLGRLQRRNPEIEASKAEFDRATRQLQELAAKQRELEADLTDQEARIKRDRGRLYGGQIVDSRELSLLERELENLMARRDELETRLIALMDEHEEARGRAEALGERLRSLQERWENDRPQMSRDVNAETQSLTDLRHERAEIAESLDPATLALYERLRKGSVHAISQVRDGVCEWCRVAIPAKDVQHARSGSLVTCTNCARILVA